jgi:hypothetical protein
MRVATKKRALSVSVSLALSVSISELRLARASSGEELTPTVFVFDSKAARKGPGGRAVGGGCVPCFERPITPAMMGTRDAYPVSAFQPVRVRRRPVDRPVVQLIYRLDQNIPGLAGRRANGRAGELASG